MLGILLDILAPKKCFSCKKEGHFLCNECYYRQDNFQGFCYICKRKSDNFTIHSKCLIENKLLSGKNFNDMRIFFDKIIVCTHYKNPVIKKLIAHFKFFGKKSIGTELGIYMNKLLSSQINLDNKEDYLILPVPMFFIRRILRGYNQSEILAKSVAKESGIEYSRYVVKRRRHTRQQARISQENRTKNLLNAFKIENNTVDNIDNKIIILVDDVISTGSTVNEISKLLKKNGAKKVIVLCLASN